MCRASYRATAKAMKTNLEGILEKNTKGATSQQAAEKLNLEGIWEGHEFHSCAKSFKMCPRFSA